MASSRVGVNFPVSETLLFFNAFLRPELRSILEVGCGRGELAAALKLTGYRVLGIDSDEEAITEARSRGVNAVRGHWPEFEPSPCDVVLFTRSLHHLSPVDAAIRRAAACLPWHGVVLVEDFAFEECPAQLIHWFARELKQMTQRGLISSDSTLVTGLAQSADPVTTWQNEHGHDLASAEEMETAMRTHFGRVEAFDAPYLYRYLWPALEHDPSSLERMKTGEMRFTEEHSLRPLGRRFVAQNPQR